MEIKGGILEGKVIGFDEVNALADLPPREILLGQVASVFQAPIAGLVNVQGPMKNLVMLWKRSETQGTSLKNL